MPSSGRVYGDVRGAALGVGASLQGAIPFPASNAWNTDISRAPVDPNSETLIRSIGWHTKLHPDFGAGLYRGKPMGIPYVVVSGTQKRVPIVLGEYQDESDPGPYPIPADAPIEGGPTSDGDRHVIVIDRDHNRLYEIANAYPQPGRQLEGLGWRHLPPRQQRGAPHRQAGVDQRRRGRPAHLPRAGAL
ncbi:MAG: hypothetical protein QM742_08975 [Aquabacterium sp.]